MTERKSFPLTEFKTVGQTGEFSARVAVFNNVDYQGDMVMPGAFADDLSGWKSSGDPMPVIWNHEWGNPFAHIGWVTHAAETAKGLEINGRIDLSNEFGKQVYNLMKKRLVKEFSFAYDIQDAVAKSSHTELRKLKIREVGPTLMGANPETELLAVKAMQQAQSDHARVKSNETLIREAADNLSQVLSSLEEIPDGEGKATDEPGAKVADDPNADLRDALAAFSENETPAES